MGGTIPAMFPVLSVVFFLGLLNGSSGYLYYVTGYDSKAELDSNATLRCFWSKQYWQTYITRFNWYHQPDGENRSLVYSYDRGYVYRYGHLIGRSSHLMRDQNLYLFIDGAKVSDEGNYTCQLTGSYYGYTRSDTLNLSICKSPGNLTITTTPEAEEDNIKIVEGERMSITAISDCGRPQPNMTISTFYGYPEYSSYDDCEEGLAGTIGRVEYKVYIEHYVTIEASSNCLSNWTEQRTLRIDVLRGPNHFTRTPANTGVAVGDTARLYCTVNRLEGELFEWLVYNRQTGPGGRRIFVSAAGVTDPSKYAIEGTYNLVVHNVTLDDAGVYRCRLVVANRGHYAALTILGPTTCEPPWDTDVEKNQQVELACSVHYAGQEAPLLTWSSSGVALSSRNDTDEFKARYMAYQSAIQENHGREYRCDLSFLVKPYNPKPPVYTDSCMTRFFVLTPVHSLKIEPSAQEGQVLQVKIGNVFRCTAQGRPVPAYTWTRNAGNGPHVIYGSVMEVTRAMTGVTNEYECMAENNVKGQRHQVKATVRFFANETAEDLEEPPHHVAASLYKDAQLTCSVTNSTGFGWLQWYFHHFESSNEAKIFDSQTPDSYNKVLYSIEGTYNLRVKRVRQSSAGTYKCRIMPKAKTYSAELIVIADQTTCDLSRHSYVEGELVRLPCQVTTYGNIAPQLTWEGEGIGPLPGKYQKVGNYVQISSTIVASHIYDEVALSCHLHFPETNCDPAGKPDFNDTCITSINVTSPVRSLVLRPNPDDYPGGILRFRRADRTSISCSASGSPPAKISWRKACGSEVVTGSELQIDTTMEATVNIYECRAWNEIAGVEYEARRTITFYVTD